MDLEQRASDERKKWEKSYVYKPYPKMLYRGLDVPPGWEHCTVGSQEEEDEKVGNGQGWKEDLPAALAIVEERNAEIGRAAAERAASDRKMSAKAQAEAKAAEDANDGQHLGEVPESKRSPLRKTLTADDEPPDTTHSASKKK